MSNPIFLGIDLHSKFNKAVYLNNFGDRPCKTFPFDNNLPGANSFIDNTLEVLKSNNFDSILIGMEATSVFAWHLQTLLINNHELAKYQLKVYSFNPKLIAGFKKAYNDLPKTDDVDAFVIADRLRFGRLPVYCQIDQRFLPLSRLTRYRFHLMHTIAREKNHFLTNLFLKFSTFSSSCAFSNLFGKSSLELLKNFYSVEEIAQKDLTELASFIAQAGNNRFKDPQTVAYEVQKAARDSYRLSKVLAEPINIILGESIETIRTLESSVKRINEAITRQMEAFEQRHILMSIRGIGPVFASGILAEIGDITRFEAHWSLAKFAGLTWSKHQTGNFEAEETRMIKSGNRYLRYYLIEAASSLMIHNPVFKAYYQKKYAEVPKHQHKRALVLTARKLVRVIFYLLKSNRLYQMPTVDKPMNEIAA